MIRGIYSAATGMLADQYVLDAVAGNLANLNTAGYKQDTPSFRSLQALALNRYDAGGGSTPVGAIGMGAAFDGTHTSLAQGALSSTGNPLDLALSGPGFISVQTAQGAAYTRDGKLHLQPAKTPDGKAAAFLVDESGNRVLGQKGAINVGTASEVTVGQDGSVVANGAVADKLKLVDGPDGTFRKQGSNLWSATGPVSAATPSVQSGYLEEANVSPITGMVRMITVQRAYEAAQKAITSQDDELNKVITEVGKP